MWFEMVSRSPLPDGLSVVNSDSPPDRLARNVLGLARISAARFEKPEAPVEQRSMQLPESGAAPSTAPVEVEDGALLGSGEDKVEAIFTCKFPGCTRQYASTDGASARAACWPSPRARASGALPPSGSYSGFRIFSASPRRRATAQAATMADCWRWRQTVQIALPGVVCVRPCASVRADRCATPPLLCTLVGLRRTQALPQEPSGVASRGGPRQGKPRLPLGSVLHTRGDHGGQRPSRDACRSQARARAAGTGR